jgi:uncharacterized protein (TIGR01777 family)
MSKNVLIAGGSGSVGQHLTPYLQDLGYTVKILSRNQERCTRDESFIHWNSADNIFDIGDFVPDHVINLSGAGVADQKWTKQRKKIIINSRTESTEFLIHNLTRRGIKLKSFVSASAVGYYGDTGNNIASEEDEPHNHEFLSEVCEQWEEAAMPASALTDNLSILRISTVLTKDAGALDKMAKTIPFGMANYLGSGKQYLPWIHIKDLVGFIQHCMSNKMEHTVYNTAAPEEHTNYEFTDILRKVVNKKALLMPAPSFSIKLLFGEMSRVVLNSTKVTTDRITNSGYTFYFPDLTSALQDIYQS